MTTGAYGEASGPGRITPEQVGAVTFAPTRLGRRGINERQVRDFLAVVQREMRQLRSERADLIDEVQRLRSRLVTRETENETPPYTAGAAHEQAVNILSTAQQAADRYVADAHAYSRDITEEARRRGDQILIEAKSRVGDMPEGQPSAPMAAPVAVRGGSERQRQQLEAELSELRTYTEICRAHLRTYLAALAQSIEQWESADTKALPPKHSRNGT